MEDPVQTETWQLDSGTWHRDRGAERWRLAATPDGTVADARLPMQDVGRMVGAARDICTGQWFPPDFRYSPQSGAALLATTASPDPAWVPPFGEAASSRAAGDAARGLRQTPARLALVPWTLRLEPPRYPSKTLPSLPPGDYRFLVHAFDLASATLMAIDPEHRSLLMLLPYSRTWIPLEPRDGRIVAQAPRNAGGWRMELVEDGHGATLYFPTAAGLAAVVPALIGSSYVVDHFGDGPALGGPVAWRGSVWLPVAARDGVGLVGKPPGKATAIALRTDAPAPAHGFDAPVFDRLHVIWPSDEGQLVLRLDQAGKQEAAWIPWPAGLRPSFPFGCPYLSRSGSYWQLCCRGGNQGYEYVQMGEPSPERARVDVPRTCTGSVSYRKAQRIDGDPWNEPDKDADGGSADVVLPLVESRANRAVVGLRIAAPQGTAALLQSHSETHDAVLQLQAQDGAAVRFGTLSVTRPWLTALFVHEARLWAYHPELPHALGWPLER